jgi:POT family proton-dependent oligopeptide transporter
LVFIGWGSCGGGGEDNKRSCTPTVPVGLAGAASILARRRQIETRIVNSATVAARPEDEPLPASEDFLGHPKGVYVCFFTEMWERFSFYGMKALLLLYLTKYHLFGDTGGLNLLGAYGGLVYCLPVIGGLLADRWLGMRKAVVFGGILLVLGHTGMAYEGQAAHLVNGVIVRDESALKVFYLSLALIIMGVGFLKPNISVIVGKLYTQDDPRRDSGFSLFYAGINLGALFASLVCGVIGEAYGWKYGFGAAGVGMLAGLAMFIGGQKYLHGHAESPAPEKLREPVFGIPREWAIYLAAVAGLFPVAGLMWATGNNAFNLDIGFDLTLAQMLMLLVLLIVLGWFCWFVTTQCDRVQRHQMIVLMVLIFMALVFFTLYEQTYGSWVVFTDRLMTKDFFPSLIVEGGQLPLWWSAVAVLILPAAFAVALAMDKLNPGSALPRIVFIGAASIALLMALGLAVLQTQTAGSLTFIASLFVLLLAPVFTGLWGWLGKRGMDPSKPAKSAFGLLAGALAFVPLALAAQQAGATGAWVSVWWLVLAYFILEIGEMCLSPVGLSAVTQLSVRSVASLMMGTWFLATAFSELLAHKLGTGASIEDPGAIVEHTAAWTSAAATYAGLFWELTIGGIVIAVIAFAFVPLLRRGMHGVK